MTRGLYVDRWRSGYRSSAEIDSMLQFANAHGVTDLFFHNPRRDRGTSTYMLHWGASNFDPMTYLLAHAGTIRVHVWFSTWLLCRKGKEFPNQFPAGSTVESHGRLCLDNSKAAVRTTLLQNLSDYVTAHPGIAGIHIEKPFSDNGFDPTQFVTTIKNNAGNKIISATVRLMDSAIWSQWQGVKPVVMLLNSEDSIFDQQVIQCQALGVNNVALGIHREFAPLARRRARVLRDAGFNIGYFSYGTIVLGDAGGIIDGSLN